MIGFESDNCLLEMEHEINSGFPLGDENAFMVTDERLVFV